MADADKERVAKVKADLPPMPKQPKAAKGATADKVPRAKSAYLVSSQQKHCCAGVCPAQLSVLSTLGCVAADTLYMIPT